MRRKTLISLNRVEIMIVNLLLTRINPPIRLTRAEIIRYSEVSEEFVGRAGSLEKPVSKGLRRLVSLHILRRRGGTLYEIIRTPPSYQKKFRVGIPEKTRAKDALLVLTRRLEPESLAAIRLGGLGYGIRFAKPYQSELERIEIEG